MKKLYLSLGAILFSGVLLASCGSNSGISAPKKGKAVDSVKFKVAGEELEFKKDDKYIDVVEKILDKYMYVDVYHEDDFDAFKYEKKETGTITGKNYIGYAENIKLSPYYKASGSSLAKMYPYKIFDNYSINGTETASVDYYYKDNSKENIDYTTYINSTQSTKYSMTYNKDKASMEMTRGSGIAGNYVENSEKVTVDGGRFDTYSTKTTSNSNTDNTNMNGSGTVYQYLDKTEKKSDTDFNTTYRGQAGFDSVSYKITEFFDYDGVSFDEEAVLYKLAILDSEDMKDFYEANFELTENYIILKCKTYLTDEMRSYASSEFDETPTDEQMTAKLKELKDKEFKGSYDETEIWLNYSVKDGDSDNIELTYSYYKSTSVNKKNIEKEITNDLLEDYYLDKESFKDYVGKKQTIKENTKTVITKAYSKDKYDSKIKSMKNKCKKNNIFDKITMIKDLGE